METALKDLQAGQQGSGMAIGVGAMGGMASMGGGRAREEEKERREKEARAIFIVRNLSLALALLDAESSDGGIFRSYRYTSTTSIPQHPIPPGSIPNS
jgi:hypothetical protein